MNKTRNSSIELLRILSMLFIVCSHFCVHGSFETNDMSFSANKIILQIGVLGNLGVVVFVMISGYFLSQSQFKAMRIIKILLQVLFYSCMIYFVLVALNLIHFSVIEALKALFPILFKQYWFATAYVILYVLSPFLNMLLNSFSFKQFVAFLSVCVCVWCVLPTLTAQDLFGNEICQFVVFYSLGAFANRYPNIDVLKKNRYWIVALASVLLLLSNIILNLLAIKMPVFNQGCYFYSRNSVLIVAIAYGLLLVFTNITIKPSRIINTISSTTFGIYLIHDNHHLREFIWGSLLQVDRYKYSDYLVLFMPLCIAAVFVACAIIDYFRQILLERPLLHVLEPLANRISQKTESVTEEKQLLNKRY